MEFKSSLRLGEILVNEGVITAEQRDKALAEQKKTGQFIGAAIVNLGFAKEEDVFNFPKAVLRFG